MLTGPPIFLAQPASQVVTVGVTVILCCNVSGISVNFAWERRSNGGKWSRINIRNTSSSKYDVRNIQQSQQYRCIASNPACSIISNVATIQVLSKYISIFNSVTILICMLNIIIEITTHPDNKHAKIGSTITLTCTSSLSSDVTFTWTHNGIIRQQQPINSITSRLTISNVSYSDSGSYMCIVRRGSLSVTSNISTITVYSKLK